MKTLLTAISLSLAVACGSAPAPIDADAGVVLPAPEPIDAYTADVILSVHPTTCTLPDVTRVDPHTFEAYTGVCGTGACRPDCVECLGGIWYDGNVIVATNAAPMNTIIRLAFEQFSACEGTELDRSGYIDVLDILHLRY